MYAWFKLVHIMSVVVFLGNIITGLFWHALAERTRNPAILAHTMAGIIRSDRLFTIPGVIGIVASGLATAILGHLPILRTAWILWTIVLFVFSGLAFALRVAPLQRRLFELACGGENVTEFDFTRYHRLTRQWEWWGGLALLAPALGLMLMVLKPT